MPNKARIRLWSTNVNNLNYVVNQIKGIVDKTGVSMRGPIPLPTRRMEVPVMRLPHGEGRKKWEKWEMSLHKRIIDIS
ncbi:MAG: 30S ribosomal protein S10, partial [Metallosphaera sp.]